MLRYLSLLNAFASSPLEDGVAGQLSILVAVAIIRARHALLELQAGIIQVSLLDF